eukprot:TRINITY_DN45887_c0_g1_i1.p1 TRINITY_DN45887_c0_g1~~TRINITY_DN45887_c0_g1_i1.p1  ORF type:complete len:505 (+),score=4.03 TRINITY_DN45887_c0_g1_i1:54-1517(+)
MDDERRDIHTPLMSPSRFSRTSSQTRSLASSGNLSRRSPPKLVSFGNLSCLSKASDPTALRPPRSLLSMGNMSLQSGEMIHRVTSTAGRKTTLLDVGSVSAGRMTLNLVVGGLGTGMLSLPWSMAGTGWLPSIAIMALTLCVNKVTIMILVRAAEEYNAFDMGHLLSCLPGRLGSVMHHTSNVFIWFSVFVSLVSYFVVIADSITLTIGRPDLRGYVVLGSSVLLLPLCFLDQSRLAFTSFLSVGVTVYICVVLVTLLASEAVSEPLPEVCIIGLGRGTVAMTTSMMQAVIIQMCVLPMYEELELRTPREFEKSVTHAFAILFLLFAIFSTTAYFLFGPNVSSNVLQNLPVNLWTSLAQLGMVVAVVGVYPILLMPMVAPVRHSDRFGRFADSIGIAIVIASSCISLSVQDLGVLNVFNGALMVGVFVGIIPGLVGIYLLKHSVVALSMLIVVAVVTSLFGFVFTSNFVADVSGDSCFLSGQIDVSL